jgi:AcrR family transcriptional regulator
VSENILPEQDVIILKQRLLDTGVRLVCERAHDKPGLEALDVAAIARAAGVEEAEAYVHFRDRDDLWVGIIEHGLNAIRAEVMAATAEAPAGIPRVLRALEIYLDGNLARPGLRALLHELRNHPPALELSRQRTAAYGVLMGFELGNNKIPHGRLLGRLCAVLAVEVAIMEFEAGGPQVEAREQFRVLLQRS